MTALLRSAALLCVLAAAASANAQTPVSGFDLERQLLNPGASASLVSSTGDILEPGHWRVSIVGHYQHQPLVVRGADGTRLGSIVGSRATAHVLGAISPLRFLELGLNVPVVLQQGGDDFSSIGAPRVSSSSLGVPLLFATLAPLQESLGSGVDLGLQLALGLPSGVTGTFSTDRSVQLYTLLGVGKTFDFVRLGAQLGARFRPDTSLVDQRIGRSLLGALSLTTTGDELRGELTGQLYIPLQRSALGGEVLVGLRYGAGLFDFFALGGPGFGAAPGTPVFRVLAGLALRTPPKSTEDVPRPVAEVALAPRCVEGEPYDLKGCPGLDRDNDGLRNEADACPEQAGTGTPDGCPVRDSDRDGVPDDKDACPEVAAPETGGCPPPPPPADTDGDGVADQDDQCPNQAGVTAREGCPEKAIIQLRRDKLVIEERIFFGSGGAKMLKKSFPVLNEIAKLLLAHPEVGTLLVEGHTDSVGSREKNLALSQKRADAVAAFLQKAGVPAERLKAVGIGPDQPLETNQTVSGREHNRRVEFRFETAGEP